MSTQSRERSRREKAAAVQAQQARAERNRKVAIALAVVVVLAVIVGGGYWATRGSSSDTAKSPAVQSRVEGNTLVVGNKANAPLKVTVYEDFLCPYCQQFERQTRSFLRADAASGKVLITYKPFQLLQDSYSTRALNAWGAVLKDGTAKQALSFHDLLYDNQPYEQDANKPDVAALASLAKKAGVSSSVTGQFGDKQSSFLTGVQQAASQQKVTSTPTILVNGKPLEGSSIDDLVSNLQQQISAEK